eukprot:gene18454-20303_t
MESSGNFSYNRANESGRPTLQVGSSTVNLQEQMIIKRIGMVYGILMQSHCKELSLVQRLTTVILTEGGVTKKCKKRLQKVGMCLSYTRKINMLQKHDCHFNRKLVDAVRSGKSLRGTGGEERLCFARCPKKLNRIDLNADTGNGYAKAQFIGGPGEDEEDLHHSVLQSILEINEFVDGLRIFGVLNLLRAHRSDARKFLQFEQKSLTAEIMDDVFVPQMSEQGSKCIEKEKDILFNWSHFLEDAELGNIPGALQAFDRNAKENIVTLSDLLAFVTGSEDVPPLRFSPKP